MMRSWRAHGRHCAFGALLVWTASCHTAAESPKNTTLRFAVGQAGTFSYMLAQHFDKTVPGVVFERVSADDAQGVGALENGAADLTVATADEPYFHYLASQKNTTPQSRRVSAIAALQLVAVHFVAGSGTSISSIQDLRGRSAWIGTQPVIPLLLRAFGVDLDRVRRPITELDEVAPGFRSSTLQAALVVSNFPLGPVTDAVRDGATLVPIDGPVVDRLLKQNLFLRRTAIPAGTYAGQTSDVRTVGIDAVMVTHTDLSEPLAYAITQRLFEVLPTLVEQFPALTRMDAQWAAATPIPLHPGAARFFREWELRR